MTLGVLAAMVAIGLPLVIGAVYFFGNNSPEHEFDAEKTIERLQEDFRDFSPQLVVFDSAGKGALVLQKNGEPLGLVWRMGRKYLTRLLDGETLISYQLNEPMLHLKLHDISLRNINIMVDDEDDMISLRIALDAVIGK